MYQTWDRQKAARIGGIGNQLDYIPYSVHEYVGNQRCYIELTYTHLQVPPPVMEQGCHSHYAGPSSRAHNHSVQDGGCPLSQLCFNAVLMQT